MKNRSIRFAILLATGSAFIPVSARATEYFVNNSVSSSGSGTSSSPFRTIQEGLNRAGPGDVVTVRGTTTGRTYNETPDLPTSGTSSARITLRAYPGEKVILSGSSGTRLNLDRNYWTIDGLTIDMGGGGSDAVKVRASNIIIQKCEIRNGQREGISIEQTSALTIQDCSIHDFMWIEDGSRNDAHGIMIDTGSNTVSGVVIQRNTIQRCSGDGCQIFGETGQDIATYAKNISFLNNTFIDGTTTSGQSENALDFKAADGVVVRGNIMRGYHNNKTIVVQKGCRNISIEDNVISDGLSGIEMRQEGGTSFIQLNQRVVGNLIYDMSEYALKFNGVKNLVCANNTLANIGSNGFRFESGSGYAAVEGAVIENNVSYKCDSSPYGVSQVTGLTANHNGWFQSSAGGLSGTGDKTGSIPGFLNESLKDYRLTTGSPCIDAGVAVGRPFSGAAPDLGAYEFASGPDVVPPAAVTDLGPY